MRAAPPLRTGWVLAAVLGVCLAAAVAGAVAGGVHSHVGSAPAAPRLSVLLGYVAVATILSTLVVGLTLVMILRRGPMPRDEPQAKEPPPLTRLQRTLIELALLLLVAAPIVAAVYVLRDRSGPHRAVVTGPGGAGAGGLPGSGGTATAPPAPTGSGHVEWTFFLALVVASLVILGFVAVSRRRAEPGPEPEPEDVLEPVVASGVEALASERDPRRAVIRAYGAMERTLGERGMPRLPAETPFEYLRRVLAELGVAAGPARRLTSLFEQAKFSLHEIDERMRSEALSALASLRRGRPA